MICPRRNELGIDPELSAYPTEDSWDNENCCTWCGSVNPEKVFELIKDGCTITRTDKNYKIYIIGNNVPRGKGMAKVYLQHFSREQITKLNQVLGYIP